MSDQLFTEENGVKLSWMRLNELISETEKMKTSFAVCEKGLAYLAS